MQKPPDTADFGALYAGHFRAVWRTLQRLGVHPGSVDDAAQEVFVTAWKKWNDFEGRSTERTWLLGIAIRVASDTRRKQRPTEPVSLELQTSGPGPESVTASKEVSRRVEVLLEQLEPERREVLLLVDVEGYSVPEVATATGINRCTRGCGLRGSSSKIS